MDDPYWYYFEQPCGGCKYHIFQVPSWYGFYQGRFEWFCSKDCSLRLAGKQTLAEKVIGQISKRGASVQGLPEELVESVRSVGESLQDRRSHKRTRFPCGCDQDCRRAFKRQSGKDWADAMKLWVQSDAYKRYYEKQ